MSESVEILRLEHVTQQFGGVRAVDDCDWSLKSGLIAALIGPNGAGKSTLLNLVAGALPLQTGRIQFEGVDISGWPPHRIAQRGLIRTFQVARVFDQLTVLENMLLASPAQPGESLFNAVVRPRLGKKFERTELDRALELVDAFDLFRLRNDYAAELSGGQKRLLELARALMARPKLLLLDEPMAAINPVLVERIGTHLREMRKSGVTLLLVEHNLSVVEELCDWVTVMAEGRVLATGSMAEVRNHPEVITAYLGRAAV